METPPPPPSNNKLTLLPRFAKHHMKVHSKQELSLEWDTVLENSSYCCIQLTFSNLINGDVRDLKQLRFSVVILNRPVCIMQSKYLGDEFR